MTPEAPALAASMPAEEQLSAGATLQTIEQRTRALAEVAEGLYWHGILRGRVGGSWCGCVRGSARSRRADWCSAWSARRRWIFLTVPIFVYVLGFEPKAAIAMSLAVVGVTSALGTAGHWRAGNVNLRIALAFGGVAILGTLVGVRLSRFVPGPTQLVIFGAVMLAAAVFMLRGRHPREEAIGECAAKPVVSPVKVVPWGLLVGALTGMVGVGGGFLIVPVLVLMHLSLREAVGTSLLIITGTCVVGFLGYLGHVRLDWAAMALVAAGTLPGIALGGYLHQFVPQSKLRRGFAAFLVIMAAFIFFENLGPLFAVSRGH